MHICFIVEGYPTAEDPFMPFIKNTVAEMARQGVQCSVIAPQSITRALIHHIPIRSRYWKDTISAEGTTVNVYQPLYITLSGKARKLNQRLFIHAAKKAYKRVRQDIDALYAHFWHMGVVASIMDRTKPLFIASGESKIGVMELFPKNQIEHMLFQLSGVIYVSSKCYKEANALHLQRAEIPYIILPNGFDPTIFMRTDRESSRKRLNWPLDAKIVAFVGAFNSRKGVIRVSDALIDVNKTQPVYSCFIGSGAEKPVCPRQLYVGKVDHSMIAEFLNASDIFVLPSTNEGCCNAIIEAMACGLPIVASNGSFNKDILGSDNSIQIDPLDVNAIAEAINTLVDNFEMRKRLGNRSFEIAKSLTIQQRIVKLRAFLEREL